jgi:excisionase family DNA binding protein
VEEDMVEDNQMGNMLGTKNAANLLHIHPNTLERWSDKGRIKAYRITPRGDRRFKREDIVRFLAELKAHNGDGTKVSRVG